MRPDQEALPLKGSLKGQLDQSAYDYDMSWKLVDPGLYLFRDNRWYRDDYLEAPAPLLRKWLAQTLPFQEEFAAGAPSAGSAEAHMRKWMDRLAEIEILLTPWQIANGLRWFSPVGETGLPNENAALRDHSKPRPPPPGSKIPGVAVNSPEGRPFFSDSRFLMHHYHTVSFYAALTADQRDAVIGGRLPATSLSADLLAQAIYLIPKLKTTLQSVRTPVLLVLRPDVPEGRQARLWTAGVLSMVEPQEDAAADPAPIH
jgi:hypothetical protein